MEQETTDLTSNYICMHQKIGQWKNYFESIQLNRTLSEEIKITNWDNHKLWFQVLNIDCNSAIFKE